MSSVRRFTKSVLVNRGVSFNNSHIKYPLDTFSSHNRDNNVDDAENMATAKRFFDDFMRRIESKNKDKETTKNEDRVGDK